MPNLSSAAKRHRQSLKRNTKNRAVKSELRTEIRKVREAVAKGDVATGETQFRVAIAKLDRAAVKRVIHPNRAARLKSRLSSRIKKAKGK